MKSKNLVLVFLCSLSVMMMTGSNDRKVTPVSAMSDKQSQNVKSVVKLVVSRNPDKTQYEEDEFFDGTGLVVDAEYSDGSIEKNVDYKIRKKDALKPSDQKVTITYGGKFAFVSITVDYKGNNSRYSVENTPVLENAPLKGKTYYFLGSSVTYGQNSKGEGMSDFIAKRNGCNCIKEAVSGTTLFDREMQGKGESYVKRLNRYVADSSHVAKVDAFVLQLSTNDMYFPDYLGEVSGEDKFSKLDFDATTTYGAIETILATVKETWDCPVVIYTNNDIGNATYAKMVENTGKICSKWENVTLLDLYNDKEFNNITRGQRKLWLTDVVHPTRAGYRDWWTEKFENVLKTL